jgi:hypothetical protein
MTHGWAGGLPSPGAFRPIGCVRDPRDERTECRRRLCRPNVGPVVHPWRQGGARPAARKNLSMSIRRMACVPGAAGAPGRTKHDGRHPMPVNVLPGWRPGAAALRLAGRCSVLGPDAPDGGYGWRQRPPCMGRRHRARRGHPCRPCRPGQEWPEGKLQGTGKKSPAIDGASQNKRRDDAAAARPGE